MKIIEGSNEEGEQFEKEDDEDDDMIDMAIIVQTFK